MPYFRVTYVGYVEGEYESEEAAKAAFIEGLDPDYCDAYGRSREDMVQVERFNDETEQWE